MQLFTRSMVALALLVMSLAPTLAANITILVGDNFYHGPGNTTQDRDIRTINVGDVVTWHSVGQSSHPTMSDNGAWATFRTLGLARPSSDPLHRRVALAVAVIVPLGFSLLPLSVMLGIVR